MNVSTDSSEKPNIPLVTYLVHLLSASATLCISFKESSTTFSGTTPLQFSFIVALNMFLNSSTWLNVSCMLLLGAN